MYYYFQINQGKKDDENKSHFSGIFWMSSWIKFADNKKQNTKNLGLNLEHNGGALRADNLV